MTEDVGSLVVKVAMDNSNFQQGIQNLNRSMKVIQSEFKNATSGLKDHGKGLDGLKAKQEMLGKSVDVQSKIVQKYKDKLKESKETLSKNTDAQIKLKEKVEKTKKAYEESKAILGENSTKTKELKDSYGKLSHEYTNNEEKLRNNVKTIDNWTTKVNNAESKLKGMQQNLNSVSSSIQQQESKWNQLSQKLDAIGKKFEAVGQKMSSIGKGLTAKLTTPIAVIGVAASKIGMDFEASMSNVSALSGTTGDSLKQLENKAREMGANTSKSAKDAADGMGFLALSGMKNKEMLEAIEPVLRLSEAGNLDLARASNLTTNALSALNLKVQDLPHFLDVVAQSARSSNTNIDQMAEAYITCGGTLKGLNVPLEESAVILGMFANKGVTAGEAGTALNAIITNLTAPTGRAEKALKALKITAFDSHGKFKGLSNVLFEVKNKTKNMTEENRNMYLSMIGGKEHIKDLNALLNGLSGDYTKLKGDIANSNGALNDMAKTMQDNNKGSITSLKSALGELCIKIYDVLKPAIANIVDKLKEWTEKLNNLTPAQQENIVKIAGMVAAIGPLLLIGGKLTSGIGKVITAFSTVSGAMAVVKTGAVATTPAIGALSKAFTLLNWKVALIAAAIGGVIYVGKKLYNHFSQASIQSDIFGNRVSKGTQKAVGGFEKLHKDADKNLKMLAWSGDKVTKEMAQDINNNISKMDEQTKGGLEKHKNESIQAIQNLARNSKNIDKNKMDSMVKNVQNGYTKQEQTIEKSSKRIQEILNNASSKNRELTKQEIDEINKLKEIMHTKGIQALTENEREQKVILERMKTEHSKISAEQASDIVQNSVKSKEKVVNEAEDKFNKTIAAIQRERDETGTISAEEAKLLIEEAKKQKEETVKHAEERHGKIVEEAKKQAGEHVNEVDWETGEIKSKWEVTKEDVAKKASEMGEGIKKAFNDKKDEIAKKAQEIVDNIKEKWEETKKNAITWGSNVAESLKSGLDSKKEAIKTKAEEIKGKIKTGFDGLTDDMKSIGQWAVDGLKNGLEFTKALKEKAEGLAQRTIAAIKTKFDIHSPSRVMMEIGKFVSEGLGLGIEQNKNVPVKAVVDIGNTIWDNSKQWSSKYGKDVTKILADTIKSNAYEPEEAAKTVGDKVNAIVKQKQDDLKKELDKMNIESKAKVDALQKQLRLVRNAETVGIRGTKKGTRYGIQDSYRAQKQVIEDKIKAVKDGCSKEVKVREEAVKKEIELIKKGGQQATEELKKESEARQKAVQDIDKLNDLIQKSLTRKIEKERDVALETAKLKAKESNLTKNQLDSLLNYTKNYYDKKLERDKLQAQAEQLIMSKNQKAIVELLNNYGDLYQDSGMTLGQRMVGGMKSWTDMVPGIVNSAMGKVETSVQQTSVKVENSLMGIMNKIATVGKAMLGIGIAQPKKENSFDNIFSNWENTWQEDKEEDVAKKIADKYKEAFNRIELAQIELGRETKNADEELKKQQATLYIQKDKLSTLKNKYDEMKSSLGSADDEVVSLKKDIASLTIEIENQEQKLAVDTIRNEAKEYYEALELSTLKLTRETKNFNDELDLQKDLYINHVLKLGAMEEEYEKLKNILGEDSDAVKQLERDIISFNNEMASFRKNANSGVISEVDKFNDKVKNALKARYESSLATEENYFSSRSESVSKWKDENINAINAVYDARIKALDDGLKAEDRADKDKEELKRINRLKEAIQYEHNEFNKAEMNKELSKLIADRNKRLHRESVEDEKASLEQKKQNEINNINKIYEEQRRGLERQLQSTRAYYSEKLKLANLEAETQKLIVENNQEEIIKLLKEYDKDYEEAGKTLGQRLADGMAEQIYVVLDMIENIGDKLKNIRTNEIEKALSGVNYTALSSIPGNVSNSTTNNSNKVVNNNNITFNSPKALTPSEQLKNTETTLRNLAFSM